jgi:hypothetical protein
LPRLVRRSTSDWIVRPDEGAALRQSVREERVRPVQIARLERAETERRQVVVDALGHPPIGDQHVESLPVITTQHAGEAAPVGNEPLQNLAALPDAEHLGFASVRARRKLSLSAGWRPPVTGFTRAE